MIDNPLSDTDIRRLCKEMNERANIHPVTDKLTYKQAMKDKGHAILFIKNPDENDIVGHWVCIIRKFDNTCFFFDTTTPNTTMPDSSTYSYQYYHCYDFVSDFLLILQSQFDSTSNINFQYVSETSDLGVTVNSSYITSQYIEFSESLHSIIPFRSQVINIGNQTTYRMLWNTPSNNTVSSYIKIDPTKINPFKAIYICSNNSEIQNMNIVTNGFNGEVSYGNVIPSRTALFVFKYWDKSVRFDSPFLFDSNNPQSTAITFNNDYIHGHLLRLQVYLQMRDNVTFLPYIFDSNDEVDMVMLTFLR